VTTISTRGQRHLDNIRLAAIHDQRSREINGIHRRLDQLRDEQDRREQLGPWRDRTRDGLLVTLIATWERRLAEAQACIDVEHMFGLERSPLSSDVVDPSYQGRGGPPAWKL
jgi:hypothetical protein